VKSLGKSVDETHVYKIKSPKKSIADKERSLLSVLKTLRAPNFKRPGVKKVGTNKLLVKKVFPLASVNGRYITNIDVLNALRLVFFFSGKDYNKSVAKLMVSAIIESLIDDRLRQQCAGFFGINVNKSDIDERIEDIARENNISVRELTQRFEECGVNMKIFRENIKSKIIFQTILRSFSEDKKVSAADIAEAKANERNEINSHRYCIAEIFRYDEASANKILELLKSGFSFQILADNFSQQICNGANRFLRWVKLKSIEKPVFNVIKNLEPGECSPVIKTKTGYKIVCLLDKAVPGKMGAENSIYEILQATVKYHGSLFTKQDVKKVEIQLKEIVLLSSPEQFKNFCKKHNITLKKIKFSEQSPYPRELIKKCELTKKPVAFRSMSDKNSVDVILLVSKFTPDAKPSDDETLKRYVTGKELESDFSRNFKKLKASAHIEKKQNNIERIFD
jgi:parvulin-like peptidyl-prolyl isomerase